MKLLNILIIAGIGLFSLHSFAQNWTPTSAPTEGWRAVASSADGSRLMAVRNGDIYVSTNAGSTWTSTTAPAWNWFSAASSADGKKLVAGTFNGLVYTSNDAAANPAGKL